MGESFKYAFDLIFSGGNEELLDVLEKTFQMCLSSSLISLILAIPFGIILGMFNFKGKKILVVINRTLTGIPPVVCGLICYITFSGAGPLGFMKVLYTVKGMVIAQVLLITPVLIATIETFVSTLAPKLRSTFKSLKIPFFKAVLLSINEIKYQLVTTYILGFSRSIAEVGAISMVGGAISWHTNVMTTAIMQYTNMGNITYALTLGIILLILSLLFNIIISIFQKRFDYETK